MLILWCSQLTHWKSPWCWERLRAEEEGVRGWDGWRHRRCNEHELGQTLGDGEGQEGLACCRPWAHKESHTTGWLNNNSNFIYRVDFSTVIFSYQVFWLSSCLKADIHLQLSGSASGTTWQRDFILLLIIMQLLTNLLFLQSNHWCCVELFMKQLLIISENYKGACHNEHWNNKKDGNSFHLLSFSYVLGVLL